MGVKHTEHEFVLTIPCSKSKELEHFLFDLELDDESMDIFDMPFYESSWELTTTNGDSFLLFIGTEKIHILIRKGSSFEKLKDLFLNKFPLTKD